MGCTGSRDPKVPDHDSADSNQIMVEILDLFSIVELLMLRSRSMPAALMIMNTKKRTEEYYAVITNSRKYWTAVSNTPRHSFSGGKIIEKYTEEQQKEREQLIGARKALRKAIEVLKPDWKLEYSSVDLLKLALENEPELMHALSEMYCSHYGGRNEKIKEVIRQMHEEPTQQELEIIKQIKAATINVCKNAYKIEFYGIDPKGPSYIYIYIYELLQP